MFGLHLCHVSYFLARLRVKVFAKNLSSAVQQHNWVGNAYRCLVTGILPEV